MKRVDPKRFWLSQGVVAVEAAIVLPFFLGILFALLGFQEILDARLRLTQNLLKEARLLATSPVSCSQNLESISASIGDTIVASLQREGLLSPAAEVLPVKKDFNVNTPCDSNVDVFAWEIKASAQVRCLWCPVAMGLKIFDGKVHSKIFAVRDRAGCS